MISFQHTLSAQHLTLRRSVLQTLQINVGRKCNQACRHCHVDAAPWRTEMMEPHVAERIASWIHQYTPPIVDITGGAPELSPSFPFLVQAARAAGAHVIDRNNLTILEEPGFEDLHDFLAAHQVEIIASLPCYLEENVRKQRGNGVFQKSIRALQKLNTVGYGTRLPLNLVYNPVGPTLPPPQPKLEQDYKEVLHQKYGIVFTRLFTLTNLPIARFAADLHQHGHFTAYMTLLATHFNPSTVQNLMCRTTLSVGFRGELYDCDFNQMLGLQLQDRTPLFLWDVTPQQLENRPILTADHCYGCTAGCGSSCTGALAVS